MKIAIDISQIAYQGSGVANYTENLVRNVLAKDFENSYILFAISLRKLDLLNDFYSDIKKINENVTKRYFPLPQTVGNLLWNRLHKFNIERLLGKIDVFHSSDWIQPPTRAYKITTIHDMIIYKFPETSTPLVIATQKRRLAWVKKECDLVLTDSLSSKRDIREILRFPAEKIEVVSPGIGKEFERQNDEEIFRIRQKYGLSENYLLSVGTKEPRKNLTRLIKAFEIFSRHPLLRAEKKPVELVLVGKSGWNEAEIKGNTVKMLGFVPNRDLPGLYSGASLFVYPSLYEGFGLPVLEAMACGTPVVSSHRGSLKEVLADAGMVVDPEDTEDIAIKLVQLYIDRDTNSKLREKGFKQAALFSWEISARRLIEIYKKINE